MLGPGAAHRSRSNADPRGRAPPLPAGRPPADDGTGPPVGLGKVTTAAGMARSGEVLVGDDGAGSTEFLTWGLVSSDSHVVEPGDLWVERLPKGLRDDAPRARRD